MNRKEQVQHMIDVVEKEERELSINKISNDNRAKKDIVRTILDELGKITEDEDK